MSSLLASLSTFHTSSKELMGGHPSYMLRQLTESLPLALSLLQNVACDYCTF